MTPREPDALTPLVPREFILLQLVMTAYADAAERRHWLAVMVDEIQRMCVGMDA